MYSVGKTVPECFEMHLRGFDILFSGEVIPKPHQQGASYSSYVIKCGCN